MHSCYSEYVQCVHVQVILGPTASLEEVGVRKGANLGKEEFVAAMAQAIKRASAYAPKR